MIMLIIDSIKLIYIDIWYNMYIIYHTLPPLTSSTKCVALPSISTISSSCKNVLELLDQHGYIFSQYIIDISDILNDICIKAKCSYINWK